MKKKEASYTVELCLILPLLLFALYTPVSMGYDLYSQTKRVSVCGWNETFCAEEKVRNIKFAGNILEELK